MASKEFFVDNHYTILPATDLMPQREIEGWRWKEGYQDKYEKAAEKIVYPSRDKDNLICYNAQVFGQLLNLYAVQTLSDAGVLELWFEPVYKEVKVWPKRGTPCLVWDNNEHMYCVECRISNGDGTFSPYKKHATTTWDNYIELTENLDKLPFNK